MAESAIKGTLHISAATRSGLGFIADRILEWTNGGEVLVASRHDVDPEPESTIGKFFHPGTQLKKLQRLFPAFNFSSFFSNSNMNDEVLVKELNTGTGCIESDRKRERHCMMLGRTDHDMSWYFTNTTGIPAELQKNVSGTAADLNFIVVAHESGHVTDDAERISKFDRDMTKKTSKNIQRVHNENGADRAMLRHYFEEAARGTMTNADLPSLWRDIRAITMFGDEGHATGPALVLPGEAPVSDDSPDRESEHMWTAVQDLKKLMGRLIEMDARGAEFREGVKASRMPAYYTYLYSNFRRMLEAGSFEYDKYEKRYVTQFVEAIEHRAPSLAIRLPDPVF